MLLSFYFIFVLNYPRKNGKKELPRSLNIPKIICFGTVCNRHFKVQKNNIFDAQCVVRALHVLLMKLSRLLSPVVLGIRGAGLTLLLCS